MPSLKDVRLKITGVRKTKQITRAMNMVSSAKLRGAQARIERFRTYADRFRAMLADVAARSVDADATHPLLASRESVSAVGIILNTSDRGLCGSFNTALITDALALAREQQALGREVVFYCIGRKGRDAVRKEGFTIAEQQVGIMGAFDYNLADRLGMQVISEYMAGRLDEVYLVYGHFVNMMRQTPTRVLLLPLSALEEEEDPKAGQAEPHGVGVEYVTEPSGEALMEELLPRVIKSQVYRGLLDTSASEHAARMTAMDNATRNCDELIANLTRLFNKTRQAAITTDLIDIVGGVEALKG